MPRRSEDVAPGDEHKECIAGLSKRACNNSRRCHFCSLASDGHPFFTDKSVENSVSGQIYQSSKKLSPLARALVKTHFPEFKGVIIEFKVTGPHGLKLEKSPQSPLGCVLMRVVDPGALSAQGSAAPRLNDGILAVNGVTFPFEGDFLKALEDFPIEITILREQSPPLGQQIGSGIRPRSYLDYL